MKAIQKRKVPYILISTMKLLIITGVISAATVSAFNIARASDSPWFAGDPQITIGNPDPSFSSCTVQKINVALLYPGNAGGALSANVDGCITIGESVDIASYSTPYQQWGIAVRYKGDQQFHHISGVSSGTLVSGTDTFAYLDYSGNYQYQKLTTTRNIAGALTPQSRNTIGIVTSYIFKSEQMSAWMPREDMPGSNHATYSFATSSNGRYIIAYVDYAGYVKIDLDTSHATKVYAQRSAWYYSPDIPKANAISNDGRYAFVGMGAQMIDTNGCGDNFDQGFGYGELSNQCEAVEYTTLLNSKLGYTFTNTRSKFSDDGKSLEFESILYPGRHWYGEVGAEKHVTLHHAGYVAEPPLDYLALGDSFSSGEGDTERIGTGNTALKWYRDWTDNVENKANGIPREKCHISMRSYPYKLAVNFMSLTNGNWNTIACSGATAWDVKEQGSIEYQGQSNGNTPRLDGYSHNNLKLTALSEFIPGRQKQIEFVKKYQPKVITLTMGGNDVDFGGKIFSCATGSGTCVFATSEQRTKLRDEIRDQFSNLSTLYKELAAATHNQSKIYVLGYPQFINADPNSYCDSTYQLNISESEMIVNSVIYMNNVIEEAAKSAGVKYLDIEGAFGSHRLCDTDTKHVTAITNFFGANGNERQESFHPNSMGHEDMASEIKKQLGNVSLLNYDFCPDSTREVCPDSNINSASATVPPYFGDPNIKSGSKFVYYTLTNGTLVKSERSFSFWTQSYTFGAGSKVELTLYSDPTNLGELTVRQDGSIVGEVVLPGSIPAGFHTLVAKGVSYSGEPIELYQTVEVQGADSNDIDEDGVNDSIDKCAYVEALNFDRDQDNIDDACDPEVTEPKIPYRIRTGDPARTYNNTSEKINYLYIERNIYATTITGVSGDSDPDGDGWAIIGASMGRSYSNTSIPDTAPYANFIIDNYNSGATASSAVALMPNMYLRAGDYGCVQYQPSSLTKVEQGQVRTFKLIAQATDKCRAEMPNADVDGDGRPDNTQPLYMARNGDSSKGEDPTRTYLFRNFYAAEAQLGVSDYTPTGTPVGSSNRPIQSWNLLATSKDVGYSPVISNLAITTDTSNNPWPLILARKHNSINPSSNICIAYQPDSTSQIKLSTQSTRELQLMKWKEVPEGVSCE